ncbi:MAG: ABC transporter permease [Candidatus Kapabacteria bacterium]|jgi:phospholipid/cholesterol/gamma-HCH transport system permease protein|nr:ABC transporter permease [Candidatus Kapabacteria bacterium]
MKKTSVPTETYYSTNLSSDLFRLTPLLPVSLENALGFDAATILKQVEPETKSLILDCRKMGSYDSYFVIFYAALEKFCLANNIQFSAEGVTVDMKEFLRLFGSKNDLKTEIKKQSFFVNYLNQIGNHTINILKDTRDFIEFIGELILKMLNLIVNPTQIRWRDFPLHFTKAGVNALPIVLLIVFLIGVISGYQGAALLSQVGAEIYIADAVGISITRELGPLMTAILIAGRSGSAFTAEIGTMKVSEEIDALNTMGFDHIKFLVLPRVFAVMIAMPILTLMADLAGILGGLLTAITALDLTITGYLNQLQSTLSYWDVFTGVGKSIFFGFLVAAVGCFRGLQVRGGAESVGKFTTTSVVTSILLIIIADAVFTFVFQTLGI